MKQRKTTYILLVLDYVLVTSVLVAALKLHAAPGILLVGPTPPFVEPELIFIHLYGIIILLIFHYNSLYKINVYASVRLHILQIVKSLLYAIIGIAVLSFVTKSNAIVDSRIVMLYFFVWSLLLLTLARVVIPRLLFRSLTATKILTRKVLIIGAGTTGMQIAKGIADGNPPGLQVVGFLDESRPAGTQCINGLTVLGKTAEVGGITESYRVDEIVIALDDCNDDEAWRIFELCAGTRAFVLVAATEPFRVIRERIHNEEYGGVPVIGIMNSPPYMGVPGVKRLLDIVLSAAGVAVLSPLLLIIGIAIKLDSRGPALFKQKRIGQNGQPFTFYKFRSMRTGSEFDKSREKQLEEFIKREPNQNGTGHHNGNGNGNNGSTKIVDNSKVTLVGRFIRKTSIDEFPQLLNVLKGDMSLVGPRPCLPYEFLHYSDWHKRRFIVKPGCTGLWQVLARSQVGFREMVVLDLFYTYNVSFNLDMWLLFKTIPVLFLAGDGK